MSAGALEGDSGGERGVDENEGRAANCGILPGKEGSLAAGSPVGTNALRSESPLLAIGGWAKSGVALAGHPPIG